MNNLKWCQYTYIHRKAFEYCVNKLITEPKLRSEMLRRAELHDVDKMIMYLFLDQRTAQQIHLQTQPHHLENDLPRTYEDLVEAVIDYESAPYTKPDKPLNAYDFVKLLVGWEALDQDMGDKLIAVMHDFGIDRSGTASEDAEGMQYIASIGEITEEMITEEILRYANKISEEELERIIELCKS